MHTHTIINKIKKIKNLYNGQVLSFSVELAQKNKRAIFTLRVLSDGSVSKGYCFFAAKFDYPETHYLGPT